MNHVKFLPLLLLLLLLLLPGNVATARWATINDAAFTVDFENAEYFINKDGTYTLTVERQVTILKESARRNQGVMRLTYNSRASNLQILSAKTINNNIEIPVQKEFIQDKPLASASLGFDQRNQVMIAFPEIDIGSKVYIHFKRTVTEVPFKNFFSVGFIYGYYRYEKQSDVKINSKIPLYFAINDPKKKLRIIQRKKNGLHYIHVKLRRPAFRKPIDEDNVFLNTKNIIWVDIASSKEWLDMAKPVLEKYENIANSELPIVFKQIVAKSSSKNTIIEKLNSVTSMLAEKVHYLGDWRPIKGGHIPRTLDTIAKTKFGDCKDFAISTVAMLKDMGISAFVAWVKRDWKPLMSPTNMPNSAAFNHAIVKVEHEGKDYWIDPTNLASFAQGIFEDIIGRPALVLRGNNVKLQDIPNAKSSGSFYATSYAIEFKKPDKIVVNAELNLKGRFSTFVTGATLIRSKEQMDYRILSWLGDTNQMQSWTLDPYDLNSRISKDQRFFIKYVTVNSGFKTSAGMAYVLPVPKDIERFLVKVKERASDLFVGYPVSFARHYHLKKVKQVGNKKLGCDVRSPWIDARRTVQDTDSGIIITDEVIKKVVIIAKKTLNSKKYIKLQNQLNKCFNGVAIVYQKKNANHRTPGAEKL